MTNKGEQGYPGNGPKTGLCGTQWQHAAKIDGPTELAARALHHGCK